MAVLASAVHGVRPDMATISVERDASGRIERVMRANISSENLFAAICLSAICAFTIASLSGNYYFAPAQLAFGLTIILGCAFPAILFFRRASQPRKHGKTLADRSGARFGFYPELGVIPWQEIIGFDIQYTNIPGRGGAHLIATLRRPESFMKRLSQQNTLYPGKRAAPPFATVATARFDDLGHLKTILTEFCNS